MLDNIFGALIPLVLIVLLILILLVMVDADIVRNFFEPSLTDLRGLESRVIQEKEFKNHQPDKYAVLVRGSNEERSVAGISIVYQCLLENGFKPEHIYVLANAKKKKETFFHPIDDIATESKLKTLINHLSVIVDEEDLLFICLDGHGGRIVAGDANDSGARKEVSAFGLKGTILTEFELGSYLSEINPKTGILFFSFCYSGGFAERLGGAQYTAIAVCRPEEFDWSLAGKSFIGCFFEALSFRTGKRADTDKDNRISLQEAFDYTKEHHSATRKGKQRPVIKSNIPLDKIFIDE